MRLSRENLISLTSLVALTALAAVSRSSLPKLESRLQILIFLTLAGLVEWVVKPHVGAQSRWAAAVVTGLFTTGAIVLVRWSSEGLCPHAWPQCADPIAAYVKLIGL